MKRLTLPLLAVLALCGFKPAVPPRADAGPVTLSLVDRDQQRELPTWQHRGQRWVAGNQGAPYAVRLRNNSPERVLVVLSVDGLNVINGEVASPNQTGYVLEPWQSADITGWRKSQREVAQFVFTNPGNSYADRTGRPDNIGVIGIAVFNEAERWVPPTPRAPPVARGKSRVQAQASAEAAADSAMPSARASGSVAAAPAPALGTGHGRREASYSGSTTFERASRLPAQRVDIRYDSERNLVARGVIPARYRSGEQGPQAFPNSFVPDPPAYGWR
ncbi:hypothetical protein PDM28_01650 [Stenotrophomonas aracearum]|jgi:hypothetical protein|uniref:Uncharacterized protein n=1 Tax=Stenotrophomonas aracearum TaxID=3003272 RepID=A0ABY9YEM0_9GAMM|nr:hypothetical protein [Stenotrophomonas sp. A5588]WNH49066.1 hypothetical protein PDM28_01650 [Stenotrophomonas sp. A5588]